MLWEEDICCESGDLYVDLLQNVFYPINYTRIKRKKSNVDSLRVRKEGNEQFLVNDFEGALAKYNESICLAENGTEYLSLSYGNRSSCFEKLKMYNRCLVDIKMAQLNNYPERLMKKLDERKLRCNLKMHSEVVNLQQPSPNFSADQQLHHISSAVEISFEDKFGRLLRAKDSIQIGDLVLTEPDYVRFVIGRNNRCLNCGKKNMNFVPCVGCAGAMFCGENCSKNKFHETECNMLFDRDCCSEDDYFALHVLRSVIIGMNTFPSIAEMMVAVKQYRRTDPFEISHSTQSHLSQYQTFFKLSSDVSSSQIPRFFKTAYCIYLSIKDTSKFSTEFENQISQRFLVHLIIHHCCILLKNSFGGFIDPPIAYFGEPIENVECDSDFERNLYLVASYFNHSCCPNVALLRKNNLAVCKAILPIRKGDQLFVTYVSDSEKCKTKEDRATYLYDTYGFHCNCALCVKGILTKNDVLQTDPAFVNVVQIVDNVHGNLNFSMKSKIKDNCIKFLLKHSNMIPSVESQFILSNLVEALASELDMSE